MNDKRTNEQTNEGTPNKGTKKRSIERTNE